MTAFLLAIFIFCRGRICMPSFEGGGGPSRSMLHGKGVGSKSRIRVRGLAGKIALSPESGLNSGCSRVRACVLQSGIAFLGGRGNNLNNLNNLNDLNDFNNLNNSEAKSESWKTAET